MGGGLSALSDLFVDFTDPVNDLTFLVVGDNIVGTVAKVDVFENEAFSATVDIIGDGDGLTPIPVDLGAFNDVTSIEISNVADAIGYDDFTFLIAAAA